MAYVIAEIGVNHNGDMGIASLLIEEAAEAGADIVKFQLFDAEKLEPPGPRRDMLRKLQLSREDILGAKSFVEGEGMEFLCTPFDIGSLGFLREIGCEAVKIGSADCRNMDLIIPAASWFDKVIVSTGMTDGDDVIGDVLMHCTSSYPCPLQDVNLLAMTRLPKPYGFSDHSLSTVLPAVAVGMGAEYIEKHLTLDRNMDGPDHRTSLEPEEFRGMVLNIRETQIALGDGEKRLMPSELSVAKIRDERTKWRQSS